MDGSPWTELEDAKKRIDELEAELAKVREESALRWALIKDHCEDEEIVKKEVSSLLTELEIEGNSYGVPGVTGIVETLVAKHKQLERENAELRRMQLEENRNKRNQDWSQLSGQVVGAELTNHPIQENDLNLLQQERNQLLAQNSRLRGKLQDIWDADEMGYLTTDDKVYNCLNCSGKKHQHEAECVQGWIEQALSETPAESVSALLGPAVELLEATKKYSLGHGVPNEWYIKRDKELARIRGIGKEKQNERAKI